MSQAFSQSAVLAIKLYLIAAVVLLIAAIALVRWRMTPAGDENAPLAQPIPFSHKHHVGDDGIDCRYCHTSVEKSSFAGLPSTQICLTCHSQLFRDAPALALLFALSGGDYATRGAHPARWQKSQQLPAAIAPR